MNTCMEWVGGRNASGHGRMWDQNKQRYAHRVAYEMVHGEIPEGMCVRHTCDNPPCVNPDHLVVGTKADNTNDMVERGRLKVGEQLPHSKLTESDVIAIRASDKSQTELAKIYGVHQVTISQIILRKRWRHI